MFNASAKGLMKEILRFDEMKVELLLKHGTPKDQLWLTDLDITDEDKGIVFYHESGNLLSFGIFDLDDDNSFEAACKQLSRYFNDENIWTDKEMKELLESSGYDLTDEKGEFSSLVMSDVAANTEKYKYNKMHRYWYQ